MAVGRVSGGRRWVSFVAAVTPGGWQGTPCTSGEGGQGKAGRAGTAGDLCPLTQAWTWPFPEAHEQRLSSSRQNPWQEGLARERVKFNLP